MEYEMETEMRMPEAKGLSLSSQVLLGKGRIVYIITPIHTQGYPIFPGVRLMRRLALKFLHCEYREDVFKRGEAGVHRILFFSIKTHTSAEDRAAFLGAVALHTHFRSQEAVEIETTCTNVK